MGEVDLTHIGDEKVESIRAALFAHGVTFFTGQQHVGFAEHLALAIGDNRLLQHYGAPDQQSDRTMDRITVHTGPVLSIADWAARQQVAG